MLRNPPSSILMQRADVPRLRQARLAWTAISRPWIGALDELRGCVGLRAMASESEVSLFRNPSVCSIGSLFLSPLLDWHDVMFAVPTLIYDLVLFHCFLFHLQLSDGKSCLLTEAMGFLALRIFHWPRYSFFLCGSNGTKKKHLIGE